MKVLQPTQGVARAPSTGELATWVELDWLAERYTLAFLQGQRHRQIAPQPSSE